METYSFVDKETGDLIQTGSADDFSLSSSTTRAISGFNGPVSVFQSSFEDSHNLLGKSQFDYEYSSSEFFNSTKQIVQPKALPIIVESISPCPKKPRVLSPMHFYVSHETFMSLKQDIDSCLKERSEIVFSTFPKKHMWKCKYLEGSQSREVHIQCFWDNAKKSHLVEVKRVHGDGLFPHHTDIVTVLKQGLGVKSNSSASGTAAVKRMMPPAPPMMVRGSSSSTSILPSTPLTPEQFRDSIQVVFDMSKNAYSEPRLEASKMLCDIIAKQPAELLEVFNLQQELLETINNFLHDQHESIVEFGVVAAHALLTKSAVYRACVIAFNHSSILVSLIAQIRNAEVNEETNEDDFYQYAQMRRLAGKTLQCLVQNKCPHARQESNTNSNIPSCTMIMSRILQQAGFFSREDWTDYIVNLQDDVLRASVMVVTECY